MTNTQWPNLINKDIHTWFSAFQGCQVGVQTHLMIRVGDAQALRRGPQHTIAQLDQKKIFRSGFLHSRVQTETKGSLRLNGSTWIHTSGHAHLHASLIYAYTYTTLIIYKTSYRAQMDQARLTPFFFPLPDSNTSLGVTISVLGDVAVSQTCMTQAPYCDP